MTRVITRSSLRSRGSSSTSTGADPRERVKDCCRKVIAFMCTQVGVGGLIIGYASLGAFGFIELEKKDDRYMKNATKLRIETAEKLWYRTAGNGSINTLNEPAFKNETSIILKDFQNDFVELAKLGYDSRAASDVWSYPAALMFCLSVFTMIGYGNMVPKTDWGKGATVLYAVVGIPLYALYFLNMGKILAHTFRWLYRKLHACTGKRHSGDAKIIVPPTGCLWVILGYILAGSITFGKWENWGALDSVYFCLTSLCKIGIGDFVPGTNISDAEEGSHLKLVINFIYLLLGMGLIAMCYNLMRDVVCHKVRKLGDNLARALEDLRIRLLRYCRVPAVHET